MTNEISSEMEYFECDNVISALNGIFSSRLCWPSDDKNWSGVMVNHPEFFYNRMWPQVKRKIPMLIAKSLDGCEDETSSRIHEFIFIHVINELNLLTISDIQKYESILDIFEEEKICFGIRFYLKLCSEFNWKNKFYKLVTSHKKCLKIIELFKNEYNQCIQNDDHQNQNQNQSIHITEKELSILIMICKSDFDSRLKQFYQLAVDETIGDTERIKKLLNQITVYDNQNVLNNFKKELLIECYFNPLAVFEMIFNQALIVNKAQLSFFAELLSTTLKHICVCKVMIDDCLGDDIEVNYFTKQLTYKIVEDPNPDIANSVIKLIEEMQKFESNHVSDCHDDEKIIFLDKLFYSLVCDDYLYSNIATIYNKTLIMKHILDMTRNIKWPQFEQCPVILLCYLLQFLDICWDDPNKKQLIIDVIKMMINDKLSNKLNMCEVFFLKEFLIKRIFSPKASTHLLYLAYLEDKLDSQLKTIFNFRKCFHDQILHLATITKDFMWICYMFPHYEVFNDQIKLALEHILPSLTKYEWGRLFNFLRMYYYNSEVVAMLRHAILQQDNKADFRFMTLCLTELVNNELLRPMSSQFYSDFEFDYVDNYYIEECESMFVSLQYLDYLMLTNDVKIFVKNILLELATMLYDMEYDLTKLIKVHQYLTPMGKEVINSITKNDSCD